MSIQDFDNITTAMIIFNAECTRVLLIQRGSDESFPAQIAFPGGRLQVGEHIIAAAKREVKEEVGLDIDSLDFLDVYFAGDVMMVTFVTCTQEALPKAGERHSFWADVDQVPHLSLAPNVYDALKDASDYMSKVNKSKALSRLGEAIDKGRNYVRTSTSARGGCIGWDHFLGQGRVGVIGTALGMLILSHCEIRDRCVREAANFLMGNVLPDGGWGLRSILDAGEKISITESTLYVVWALLSVGIDDTEKLVTDAFEWLGQTQHINGGWGTTKSGPASSPRVFPTAFAITVLSQVKHNHKMLEKAAKWLRSVQNPDGSWGVSSADNSPDGRGTPSHTAHSLIALLNHDKERNWSAIERGVRWLTESYDPRQEQGWASSSEIVFVSDKSRLDFKHFASPWVLVALIRSGVRLNDQAIIQPIIALLNEQTEAGYWIHHLASGQIPIWATHDSLMALNEFKNSLWRSASSLTLCTLLKERQMQILSSVIQRESSRRL
jgi:8-oxo-dGTP pyrophosphatase MutT (NUDIX family)/prenyltransferase beta subunit